MALLDLPNEILNHIAEYLLLKELLDLCATCRKIQYTFNIKQLSVLARNPQATYELHYIPLAHVLQLRLSSRKFEHHSLDELTKNGASLRYILCGNLLEETFREPGNRQRVQFLLQHGASLHDVPCGINRLLEETFREPGNRQRVQFLLQHGASLHDVPCGINRLLEEVFRESGNCQRVQFLLQHGAAAHDLDTKLPPREA